jgi:hypothetical protein
VRSRGIKPIFTQSAKIIKPGRKHPGFLFEKSFRRREIRQAAGDGIG